VQPKYWTNLGYLFIWGDFYLVLFAIHAVFLSPMSFELYLSNQLQAGLHLFGWLRSLNGVFDGLFGFLYTLPAALMFVSRFTISTAIGIWMVRKVRPTNAL